MEEYNNLLSKIRPGDVILTWGEGIGLFSLPIKMGNYFKKGPKGYKDRGWTHAAVYIGDGEIIEAFPSGIVRRNLKVAYLNGKFGLNILRLKNASEENIKKAIEFYIKEHGSKYDPRGLIYFIFANFIPPQFNFLIEDEYIGKLFNVNDSYFCSELVSEGFKRANIYCFERESYKVMPIEFDNELLFNRIYKCYLPRKENKSIYGIKAFFFNCLYIITAILFPIIIALLLALIVFIFVIVVIGIIFLIKNIKKKTRTHPIKK